MRYLICENTFVNPHIDQFLRLKCSFLDAIASREPGWYKWISHELIILDALLLFTGCCVLNLRFDDKCIYNMNDERVELEVCMVNLYPLFM